MLTTVQALIGSGILTFVMLLAASGLCAQIWTPPGAQICPAEQSAETAQPVVGLTQSPCGLQVWPPPHCATL